MKVFWLMVAVCVLQVKADIQIENVKAEPISPWGKVCLGYDVLGEVSSELYVVTIVAINQVTGEAVCAKTVEGNAILAPGSHKLIWDFSADGFDFGGQKVVFEVRYTYAPYLVVNLDGRTAAASYSVSPLSAMPENYWSDEYKTTKLVLRGIASGSCVVGDEQFDNGHRVTLTKPFYIGVFEVTQRQWELILGTRPSAFVNNDCYATRPVECVSYDMIRGSSLGTGWPSSSAVDASSFLGVLRAKTGLKFDLPTDAQWEYACRAGTATDYNNGTMCTSTDQHACPNMNQVGRYSTNSYSSWLYVYWDLYEFLHSGTDRGTAAVGSYQPNAWGLYDMHGNVCEWCLDWYGPLPSGDDPCGASSESRRVARGGSFDGNAIGCRSSSRFAVSPSKASRSYGFRVVWTMH